MQHRAINHLRQLSRDYPKLGKAIDKWRALRDDPLPNWPDWCFMPLAYWYTLVTGGTQPLGGGFRTAQKIIDAGRLAAIGPWRYGQGIYRLHPAMLTALADAEAPDDIPADVLTRLPEWSVYIETPGLIWLDLDLAGFFAHLESDVKTGRAELRFLMDVPAAGLLTVPMHVGGSVQEMVTRAVVASRTVARQMGLPMPTNDRALMDAMVRDIRAPVAALLYLCSEAPEITADRQPGLTPSRPREKRTKRGWKLYPPNRPTVWLMGLEAGDRIPQEPYQGDVTGRRLRAHLRRGHWHGYWVGPKDKRRFEYRWLPPMAVGGLDDPQIPEQ